MGVVDQIKSKTKLAATSRAVGNIIAKGEAEICIYWLNEMDNPGLDVVGRSAEAGLIRVKVVAFISTHVKDPKAAKALVSYLSSPEVETTYKQDGLEPAH